MNLIYLADQANVCHTLVPVMTIVGYVIFVIKIAVPIILIVMGMITLVGAIMKQDDKEVKKATTALIKKVCLGLGVYLVVTVVGLLMNLIGANADWKTCSTCAFNPFSKTAENGTATPGCYIISPDPKAE